MCERKVNPTEMKQITYKLHHVVQDVLPGFMHRGACWGGGCRTCLWGEEAVAKRLSVMGIFYSYQPRVLACNVSHLPQIIAMLVRRNLYS